MKTCDTCGKDFSKIGTHWYYNQSHRPDISTKQMEILTGILMGDGTVNRDSGNPRLVVEMTNEEYLTYINDTLGVLSNGVSLHRTAEENAHRGVMGDTSGDYKDTYVVKTVRHPQLTLLSGWYDSGKKEFPEDLSLTPVVLKHWYVCDGYFRDTSGHNSIEIGVQNESENRKKINSYFTNNDLPEPTWYDKGNSVLIRFTNDESRILFEYMGEPVAGFSYKFM